MVVLLGFGRRMRFRFREWRNRGGVPSQRDRTSRRSAGVAGPRGSSRSGTRDGPVAPKACRRPRRPGGQTRWTPARRAGREASGMGMSANGEWAPRGAWSPGARKRRDVPGALAPRRSARCLRTSARSDVSPSSPTRPQPRRAPACPRLPSLGAKSWFRSVFLGSPRVLRAVMKSS